MNQSIWRILMVVFAGMFLSVVFLRSENSAAAETAAPGELYYSSQGTEVQSVPAPGEPIDDPALYHEQSATPSGASTKAATEQYYHIPGSALIPVDSEVALSYDGKGCVHASAGAGYLLNAPLDIPPGSQIVLLRLYYNDTSTQNIQSWITQYSSDGSNYQDLVAVPSTGNAGRGSNYGDLDHVVDTYNWSYVLNVRLNVVGSELQVCGLRVMYFPPASSTITKTVVIPLN